MKEALRMWLQRGLFTDKFGFWKLVYTIDLMNYWPYAYKGRPRSEANEGHSSVHVCVPCVRAPRLWVSVRSARIHEPMNESMPLKEGALQFVTRRVKMHSHFLYSLQHWNFCLRMTVIHFGNFFSSIYDAHWCQCEIVKSDFTSVEIFI